MEVNVEAGRIALMPHRKKTRRDDELRTLSAGDADRILELNNEHAVETSLLDLSAAERLLAMCFYAKGIGLGARGFLLALDQEAGLRQFQLPVVPQPLRAFCVYRPDHHCEGCACTRFRAAYVRGFVRGGEGRGSCPRGVRGQH